MTVLVVEFSPTPNEELWGKSHVSWIVHLRCTGDEAEIRMMRWGPVSIS